MGAYLEFWRRALDFSGRTRRSRFWQAFACECVLRLLFMFAVPVVLAVCTDLTAQQSYAAIKTMSRLYGLCFIVPAISITVRRLRDAGYTAKTLLWFLLPGIGMLALVCRLCEETAAESNSYS